MLDAGSLWCIFNRSYLSCSLVSFTVIKELDIRKRVGLVSLSVRAQSSLEVEAGVLFQVLQLRKSKTHRSQDPYLDLSAEGPG